MKGINVRKIAAFAGAAVLGLSAIAAADVLYGNTQLVDQNGQPTVKIYVGSTAAVSDGVAAANIAAKIANEAYKSSTLTASVSGTPACTVGSGVSGSGTCSIVESSKSVTLTVTLPGETAGVHTFKTLITDSIDRLLANRNSTSSDDIWNSSNANPNTANDVNAYTSPLRLASWQNSQLLYRIGSDKFTGFADYSVVDNQAVSTSYTEEQSYWVGTQDRAVDYDTEYKDIVVNQYSAMAYSAKFVGNDFGIPVCTGNLNTNDTTNWASCDANGNDRTDKHRVKIKFLGAEWVISEMVNPDGAAKPLPSTTSVTNGGEIKLAKEAKYGIINVGQMLDAGTFKVRLADISVAVGTANEHPAIIDILDANEAVVGQIQVTPGSTYTFTQSGTGNSVKIHVYKTAPGFSLSAKWAEMAIYNDEITLKDGQRYNLVSSSDADYKNFKVSLMWKNRDFTTGNNDAGNVTADSLRELVIYQVDNLNNKVKPGDVYSFLKKNPTYTLTYNGLDLTDDDYTQLSVDAPSYSTQFRVAMTKGGNVACSDNTDYYYKSKMIRVRADDNLFGGTGDFVADDGMFQELLFDPYVVAANGSFGYPNGTNAMWAAGNSVWANVTGNATSTAVLFWKLPNKDCYNWDTYTYPSAIVNSAQGVTVDKLVRYDTAGDNSAAQGGLYFNRTLAPTGFEGVLVLQEDAGKKGTVSNNVDELFIPYNMTSATDTVRFKSDTNSNSYVWYDGVFETTGIGSGRDIPYITQRGTKVTSVGTTSVNVNVAKKVGMPTFQFALADSAAATEGQDYVMKVGDSKVFGGVTVKVKAIDASAGSCSVLGPGGVPACTVDTTGVTAVIQPANAASVEVSQPYKLTSNMVMMDTSGSSAGVAILVGGPAVNTMTSDALKDSSVDFNVDTVVVKEVGSKIVVAGKTAADTMTAADQFIAGVKRQ
ncbi:Uncharacterised protein [uncultured archaeon]|nr:Uncharacterised protein [uncultured archaeon]